MITNSSLTIYHSVRVDREESWVRYNYPNVWFYGGKGAGINKGYDDANDVQIRIPYKQNDVDITNFSIGDIIVQGALDFDIETQQDLNDYLVYNITSINNNLVGEEPHIHLGGR